MSITLNTIPDQAVATVLEVRAPSAAPEWQTWLEELGFEPGESVSVLARALPGGDPLLVRVGQSRFALRSAEAACVHVALKGSR